MPTQPGNYHQTCRVPQAISHHGERECKLPKAERGLSKAGSQKILERMGDFVPVGSGTFLPKQTAFLCFVCKRNS